MEDKKEEIMKIQATSIPSLKNLCVGPPDDIATGVDSLSWVGYTTTMEDNGQPIFTKFLGVMYLTRCRVSCGCAGFKYAGVDFQSSCMCGNNKPNRKCTQKMVGEVQQQCVQV